MTVFRKRALLCFAVLALLFGVLVVRLFTIQIIQNDRYAAQSKKQARERIMIPAQRGNIYDRNGILLANSPENSIKLAAGDVGGEGNKQIMLRRVYPCGQLAGTVLGYTGTDGIGMGGAEYYFDHYLKGEDGWTIVTRDAKNNTYTKPGLPGKQPVNGSNLYLTIDCDIQKIVETELLRGVDSVKALNGMCIVMEPSTGKILAMANTPGFNPNIASKFSLEQRLNTSINTVYEPGSTYKVITAACALQEGVKKETDMINGYNGVYKIYGATIHDDSPYGMLTFVEALKYSSNICFAQIANDIGNERLYKYAKDFGFGAPTGIALPGEEKGIVHPIEKWSGVTRVSMAFGHEIAVTPLQIARAYACVANSGVLVEPRIYDKVVSSDGTVIDSSKYRPVRRVLSESTAHRLIAMMREVVKGGTGAKAAIDGIAVAGKTGTALKIDKATGTYSKVDAWASFIGFLPADQPQLLCAVIINGPAHGETGGMAAAPVFRNIMSQIISHPQLEYAEKILHHSSSGTQTAAPIAIHGTRVPDVCGMTVIAAKNKLASVGITVECGGGEQEKITYQSPAAGTVADSSVTVMLYTRSRQAVSTMPGCIGKDLRDALNVLSIQGALSYVYGFGVVERQAPAAGSAVRAAVPCTLWCALTCRSKRETTLTANK